MRLSKARMNRISTFVLAWAVPVGVRAVAAPAQAADPVDPEVVLPARVDAALHRTVDAVDRATAAISPCSGKSGRPRQPKARRRAQPDRTAHWRA
jgi:hypothetical protein